MEPVGGGQPSEEEKISGWAGRVEIYKCQLCLNITRFPRYNNPSYLLKSRLGRCGEFANAFCLICRALNLDARYVLGMYKFTYM
jgi:peptide-N4-(N-acetyl-beta-glucosaminyl)asparagine amidase